MMLQLQVEEKLQEETIKCVQRDGRRYLLRMCVLVVWISSKLDEIWQVVANPIYKAEMFPYLKNVSAYRQLNRLHRFTRAQ